MMSEELRHIQLSCMTRNLPFVTFRLPQQSLSTTYIQTTPEDNQWNSLSEISGETGFIMAPFDTRNGHRYMLIKPDLVLKTGEIGSAEIRKVESLPTRPSPAWPVHEPVVTGRDPYMKQVQQIKNSISTGAFQKAVLSRIRVVPGSHLEKIPRIFQELCRRHPNAFVYLLKNEEHFWMGASPEPLIRLRDGRVSTVSLAGTRPYAEKHLNINRWTLKEVLEQEYVTRYIHDVFHAFGIRDYRVSSPYVKKAGNLVHLRTDFSLDYELVNGKLWELVEALHPTPAVAGQPKKDAIDFIKKLEPHDRDYYTGFLGPVTHDRELDLFVNLRCLKITPRYLALYVGGGITLESDPAEEYDETVWKAESLHKIIRRHIDQGEEGHA